MLKVASGGTAASEASEVAVKPTGSTVRRAAPVTTETPAARRRNASLNADDVVDDLGFGVLVLIHTLESTLPHAAGIPRACGNSMVGP